MGAHGMGNQQYNDVSVLWTNIDSRHINCLGLDYSFCSNRWLLTVLAHSINERFFVSLLLNYHIEFSLFVVFSRTRFRRNCKLVNCARRFTKVVKTKYWFSGSHVLRYSFSICVYLMSVCVCVCIAKLLNWSFIASGTKKKKKKTKNINKPKPF